MNTTGNQWRTPAGKLQGADRQMRPRQKDDFYETPIEFVQQALSWLNENHVKANWHLPQSRSGAWKVLDPGCGTGNWGQAAREVWPNAWIAGIEMDNGRGMESYRTGAYNTVMRREYLGLDIEGQFDIIISNPPFKLAEEFLLKSLGLLQEDGVCMFLLRTSFSESAKRYASLFSGPHIPAWEVQLVQRISFGGYDGTDLAAYSLFVWDKRWQHEHTRKVWLSWR